MDTIRSAFWSLVLVLTVGWTVPQCRADEVPLLDLVDESVALCVEVPHLESTWSTLDRSRFAGRLRMLPLVQHFLDGPGFRKWKFVDDSVAKVTGKALSEQLLGLVSDSLVLAVYLPDGNKPLPDGNKPQGVIIARARDENALKLALNSWSMLEPQHVEQAKEHRGHAYVRRAKSAKSTEIVYYSVFGRTVVLSDQEALVQQAIDFHLAAMARSKVAADVVGASRTLRDLPLYRTSRARLADDCAAVAYVNAVAWDNALAQESRKQTDMAGIAQAWKSVGAVAVGLRLDDGVVVDLVAELRGDTRPEGWRDLARSSKSAGTWSDRIPNDAVLAVSSRLNVQPLVKAWLTTIPDSKREEFSRGRRTLQSLLLGRDLFDDVLPQVARNWTVYLADSDRASSGSVPVHVAGMFALELADKETPTANPAAPESVALDKCLDNALHFGLNLGGAYLSHKRDRVIVTDSELTPDGIKRSLHEASPWSPSYSISPGQLFLSTSGSHSPHDPAAPPMPTSPHVRRLADCERKYFAGSTQLLWIDSVRIRDLLVRRGDWLVGQLATETHARERLALRFSRIAESLKTIDAAFLAASLNDDHVRVTIGVALDQNESADRND